MNNFDLLTQLLHDAQIPFTLQEIHANSLSIEDHVKALGITYKEGMSTLIFKYKENGNSQFCAIFRRDDQNIDSKALKKLCGKSTTFCTEEELALLGFEPGLVSPLLLNKNQSEYTVKIIVDKHILENDHVYCGSTSPHHALEIKVKDLLENIGLYSVEDITIPNPKRIDIIIPETPKIINYENIIMKKRILTGDRPTGYLHVGHYVGTIANRIKLQDDYDMFLIVADVQGLTDNFENPQKIRDNLYNVIKSNIAAGVDPNKATFFIQSLIPEIAELTIFYANLVSIQKLGHNPTVKTELAQKGMEESTPLGFFMYPVSQAADITIFNANLVPVGKDQAPMIEDTREIGRKFNQIYGDTIVLPEPLYGLDKNLPGVDGNEKMGKSLGNAIYLHESKDDLRKKIMSAKTDPNRIRATDPGTVEGNTVFVYHDMFNTNLDEVEDLKTRYRAGTVGDVEVKEKLLIAMENFIAPIRDRMAELDQKPEYIKEIAMEGTQKARKVAQETMIRVREAMKIDY